MTTKLDVFAEHARLEAAARAEKLARRMAIAGAARREAAEARRRKEAASDARKAAAKRSI
jgi:hypothetical protein